MPLADKPIDPSRISLIMVDDIDDEDDFEIIDVVELPDSSDEEEEGSNAEQSSSDEEYDRKLSCVPSTEHASFVFRRHKGPVFCIGLDPQTQNIVITGGQDDKALIWNTYTGNVFLESDFKDSVILASFNHDGKFVAAADMAGNIKVWKNASYSFNQVWQYDGNDIKWMKWHPMANVLLVGEGSVMSLFRIPSGECKIMHADSEMTDVGGFTPDGRRAIACSRNGTVKIFNLVNTTVLMKYDSVELNSNNFISLDVHPDNNLIVLGSLTSRLYVLKTQNNKMLQEFTCIEDEDKTSQVPPSTSVECVAFSRKLPYNVIVAATDNALHVYDYVKSESRGSIAIEEGITKFVWPEGSHIIYVGTKVGKVAVCDIRALQRVGTFEGHSRCILDLAITKDNKTLIASSDDETVRIFEIEKIAMNEGYNFLSTESM